jgi:L-fuculose-phosphate aldolase
MKKDERALRQAIIDKCRWMNAAGLNQGTSGNISARWGGRMLITPSAVPYDEMAPEMLASMALDDGDDSWQGPLKPSTEWRFHRDILRARPDAGAVVHTHALYCTTLSIARKTIPAVHYMIAAFGGPEIRCAPYALYGTEALSRGALAALEGRNGCLLANHGMIAVGPNLDRAMWLAVELETLAKQYYLSLSIGGPVLLTEAEIAETARSFAGYGVQGSAPPPPAAAPAPKKKPRKAA